MQDKSLKQQLFTNITIVAAINLLGKLVNIIAGVAIARILSPEDFGIWGLALSIMAIIEIFNEMGLKQAVIQKQTENEPALFMTGMFMKLLITSGLFLILYFFVAPAAAGFFEQPALAPITVYLAVVMLINNTQFIPETRIIRSNDFRKMLFPSLMTSLSYSVAAVGLALAGFEYWSFVYAKLISAVVGAAAYYYAVPWKLDFIFDRALARDLYGFGKFILVAGIIDVFILQIDKWVVGKTLGLAALGYYALAFRWSGIITLDVAATFNKALWPLNVNYQSDPAMLDKIQHRSMTYTSLLLVPITVGFAAVCPEVVRIFFGEKWTPSITPLQIMAFHSLFWALAKRGNFFEALGAPRYIVYQKALNIILLTVLIFPLTDMMGINGTAWSVTGAKTVAFFFIVGILLAKYRIRARPLLQALALPALGSLIMAAAVFAVKHYLYGSGMGQAPVLAVSIISGTAAYTGCMAILMNGEMRRIGAAVFRQQGSFSERVKAMIVAL